MPVHNLFPTPVYMKQAVGNTLRESNKDLWNQHKKRSMKNYSISMIHLVW